jgi:hypothetical protein
VSYLFSCPTCYPLLGGEKGGRKRWGEKGVRYLFSGEGETVSGTVFFLLVLSCLSKRIYA